MNDAISQAGPSTGATNRVVDATRTLFALIGITAVLLYALPAPLDTIHRQIAIAHSTDSAGANYVAGTIQAKEEPETPAAREQRAVAEFVAKRYRVAEEAAARFVTAAYRAGTGPRSDPPLILAVVAVEFASIRSLSVYGARD